MMLQHFTFLLAHLNRGKRFHHYLQKHFIGEQFNTNEIETEILPIWNSVKPLLENFQAPGVIIEEKLRHPYLMYQGVVDCVSFHDSTLSIIEWKKSDRQKKSLDLTYDAPIQLCSYLGALNASREELQSKPIKKGIVVVAYNDGQRADLFELKESELKRYWKLWVHRLQEYWVRYKENNLPDGI
jgi:mitochondrial genome maintenance exonuclease 1